MLVSPLLAYVAAYLVHDYTILFPLSTGIALPVLTSIIHLSIFITA